MSNSQEHQEYIQQKVNPILENLVTQLLLERPEHLAPFIIKWLGKHSKTTAAAALTEGVSELSAMKAELEKLQKEVKELEAEVGDQGGSEAKAAQPGGSSDAKGKAAKADADSEEEEDDDDDVEELAPVPAAYTKTGPRASVSAEAYGKFNVKKDFTAPVYPKTDDQKARIKSTMMQSFLFSSLRNKDVEVLVGAVKEKICPQGERIINQGEDGEVLYIVEEGTVDCFKKQEDVEKLVKQCRSGDYFGELALLYNAPRAASVVANTKCTLWELDRETFNNIVKEAAAKRREKYDAFFKKIPLLESMEAYERNQMCDALRGKDYNEGDVILKQGDSGDTFYILEDGECIATKVYVDGAAPVEVMKYKSGDYFGELALLSNDKRAASVTAKTACHVLTLDRKTFKLLLGPLEEILRSAAEKYE